MATTLTEYLKENPGRGFQPVPQYFASGDFLTYFLKDVPYYAERLGDVLTVYLSVESKELVGVKVKGVQHILKAHDVLDLTVDDGHLKLSVFIFAGAADAAADGDRAGRKAERFAQLVKLKDVLVDRKELLAGC